MIEVFVEVTEDAAPLRLEEELLENASFAEHVDRLPFRSGDTVVDVGPRPADQLESPLEPKLAYTCTST
jgi:hypothetical protein